MKKIAVAVIITALVLGIIYGTVSGSAAVLSLTGVDNLKGDSTGTTFTDTNEDDVVDICDMGTIGCTVE